MMCCTFVYSVINLTWNKQYVFFIHKWLVLHFILHIYALVLMPLKVVLTRASKQ